MLSHLLITALRNSLKHKAYSIINILGLSLALATCFIIASFVRFETSFDAYHEKKDRTFRVIPRVLNNDQEYDQALTNTAVGLRLKEIAAVESTVRIGPFQTPGILKYEEKFLSTGNTGGFYLADPEVFDLFSVKLIKGDPQKALHEPFSLVLSQSMAKAAFGEEDPMGKVLLANNRNEYVITGVFADLPNNTQLQFDYILSFSSLGRFRGEAALDNYRRTNYYTYVLLAPESNPAEVSANFSGHYDSVKPEGNPFVGFSFQPIADIHLSSGNIRFDFSQGGENYIVAFTAVATFILLIGCFNFMNLSTARAMRRAKEVGVRKVLGAKRHALTLQFLGEAMLVTLLSALIGGLMTEFLVPAFNYMAGSTIQIDLLSDLGLLLIFAGIALFTALMSGAYPALYLASFRPTKVLKKTGNERNEIRLLKKSIVVFQFFVAATLLLLVTAIDHQIQYMSNKDIGFERDNVVVVSINSGLRPSLDAFRNDLLVYPQITAITQASTLPGQSYWTNTYHFNSGGERKKEQLYLLETDPYYFETLNIDVLAGRNFDSNDPADATTSFIVNEAAVEKFGWTDPVGEMIYNDSIEIGPVIGVVKNFHFKSLHTEIEPLIIDSDVRYTNVLGIRIDGSDIPSTLKIIEDKFSQISPEFPFNYRFLDEQFDRQYKTEQQLGVLLKSFSGMAVFIAILGLIGLVSFTTERRRKEIGVRKVMGAEVTDILKMLTAEFNITIGIGLILALPISYYLVDMWLDNYAYKSLPGLGLILLVLLALVLFSWLALSFQSIRSAIANPVEAIREE